MISHENFNLFCWIWIGIGIIVFPVLLKVTQPYGKHAKNSWGPMINNRLGWLLMELPALLVFGFFLSYSDDFKNRMVLIAALLWGLHYIHRSLIFPFRIKTKGKKMPVIIVFSAVIFNVINGFFNGYWLSHFAPEPKLIGLSMIHLVIGTILFVSGFLINQYHDWLLIHLRKNRETGYKIPFGGLFRYISCPNYFGEIISWLGFFIITLGLPAFSFFIWTMVNLLPRALDNHRWYKKQFPGYPVKRKAIIPFIM